MPDYHRAGRAPWLCRLANGLLTTAGWRVRGEIPESRKFVLVLGPHTSNWDFVVAMAVMLALDIRLRWLGKHSLFKKPFDGFMTWLGGVPVNRTQAEGFASSAVATIRDADTFILAITPEGTRSKVARLKTGFSRIAREIPCPILPVTMDFARKEVRLHPLLIATNDSEADAEQVRGIFASAQPKCPQLF